MLSCTPSTLSPPSPPCHTHVYSFTNAADDCYYPDTSDLSEYVLNNGGKIWFGELDDNYGRPWQFAQFTKDSLEVALWIVDHMPVGDRSKPVQV